MFPTITGSARAVKRQSAHKAAFSKHLLILYKLVWNKHLLRSTSQLLTFQTLRNIPASLESVGKEKPNEPNRDAVSTQDR